MSNETKTNKPKGYVIYPDQWKALKGLSLARLGRVFKAVYETLNGVEGAEKELIGSVRIAYDFLRVQFDMDVEKYERAKALKAVRDKRYREKIKVTSRDASPFKEIEKEIETEKENENEKEKESTTSFVGSVENSGKAAIGISDTANSQKEAAAGPKDLEFFERVFKPYVNNIIRDSNIPPIRKITPERYEKILKLREQYTSDDIYRVFQIAARSDFLNERGRKHKFQATFDWLIEPENFLRVLEGTYR